MLSSLIQCLIIWSRQVITNKMFNASIGGTLLNQVSSVCYLGVTIDPTLSWNLHVSIRVQSRVASILCFGSLYTLFTVYCSCTANLLRCFLVAYYCQVYWYD